MCGAGGAGRDKTDQEDWILEQAIKFLRDSFDNFKAREALTQAANLIDQLAPVITSDGAIASAAATAMAVGTMAATTTPTSEWDL